MAAHFPITDGSLSRRITLLSAGASALVAIIAMCVSFGTTRGFAIANGVAENVAWLIPLAVDGTIIASVVVIVWAAAHGHKAPLAWAMMVVWTLASVWMNSAHSVQTEGWDGGWTGALIHASMPAAIWCTVENLRYMLKHSLARAASETHAVVEAKERAAGLLEELTALRNQAQSEAEAATERNGLLAAENSRLTAELAAKQDQVPAAEVETVGQESGLEAARGPDRGRGTRQPQKTRLARIKKLSKTDSLALALGLERRGLTQAQAAAEMGISLATYKRWLGEAKATQSKDPVAV